MGFAGMQKMMRQVQKMQAEMQRVQEEAGRRTVDASAGGGAVVATCNGRGDLVKLTISPEAVDAADPEMLADLVVAAVNEALRQARDMLAREMARLAPGLPGVPGVGEGSGGSPP